MKFLYLLSNASLIGIIIFLIYNADKNVNFPFGGPHKATILKHNETGNSDALRSDGSYVGYRANNQYRLILAFIGTGVSVTGVIGWIAIRKTK